MATKKTTKKPTLKQKEELLNVLKFTPRTYKVQLWGYGGETAMGNINREVYDYFRANRLSVSDFAWDGDYCDAKEIPEDMQPFVPGSWYECDGICHTNGVSLDAGHIQVDDENGDEILNCELDNLDSVGIEVEYGEEYSPGVVGNGVVFLGRSNEKGTFFEADLELTAPFNPKKLRLITEEVNGENTVYSVTYDGEDLDNWGGDTTGKSSDFYFIVVEDGEEVESYSEPESDWVSYWPEDYERTKTFKIKATVKKKQTPEIPGWYYCTWSPGFGTSSGLLEWTGEIWQEYEYDEPKTVDKVTDWTGLNWDTSDMNNKPKRKPRTPKLDVYPYPSQEVLKAAETV
jgi:hypothetical protein